MNTGSNCKEHIFECTEDNINCTKLGFVQKSVVTGKKHTTSEKFPYAKVKKSHILYKKWDTLYKGKCFSIPLS